MFGLISQFFTEPDHRDALAALLATATQEMPGCVSYVIALDTDRTDVVWITEVWRDADSHAASLQLPAVQAAMQEGRAMITGIGPRITTRPVAAL